MSPAKELADLAIQKRMLIAESEACRATLAADLHGLTSPLHWVDRLRSGGRPAVLVALPLAGFLLTRRLPKAARWLARGFGAMRLFGSLRSLIRSRRPG